MSSRTARAMPAPPKETTQQQSMAPSSAAKQPAQQPAQQPAASRWERAGFFTSYPFSLLKKDKESKL